jgi:hypothetical protein
MVSKVLFPSATASIISWARSAGEKRERRANRFIAYFLVGDGRLVEIRRYNSSMKCRWLDIYSASGFYTAPKKIATEKDL